MTKDLFWEIMKEIRKLAEDLNYSEAQAAADFVYSLIYTLDAEFNDISTASRKAFSNALNNDKDTDVIIRSRLCD